MKSVVPSKQKGTTNRPIKPVATTSRCLDKRALTARGISNTSSQIISPDISRTNKSSREELSKVSHGAREKCSTGKARSPMQCAEMVFGNLTNISPTGSPISHDIKSVRQANQQTASQRRIPHAFKTMEVSGQAMHTEQAVNDSFQEGKQQHAHSFTQLASEQQALQMTATGGQPSCLPIRHMHQRSNTMPDLGQATSAGTSFEECVIQASTGMVDHLRQENMILAAEKSTLQAELSFYKSELAKLCLRTGSKFPVFRSFHLAQTANSSMQSSMGTTQILGRAKSGGMSRDGPKPKYYYHPEICKNSESTALGTTPPNTTQLNPQIFYASKQMSSEDRYLCVSQGGMEDQVSTTLSLPIQRKSKENVQKKKLYKPAFNRKKNEKGTSNSSDRINTSIKSKKSSHRVLTTHIQETSQIDFNQSTGESELKCRDESSLMKKPRAPKKNFDKENQVRTQQQFPIVNGSTQLQSSQNAPAPGCTSSNKVHKVTVNLAGNRVANLKTIHSKSSRALKTSKSFQSAASIESLKYASFAQQQQEQQDEVRATETVQSLCNLPPQQQHQQQSTMKQNDSLETIDLLQSVSQSVEQNEKATKPCEEYSQEDDYHDNQQHQQPNQLSPALATENDMNTHDVVVVRQDSLASSSLEEVISCGLPPQHQQLQPYQNQQIQTPLDQEQARMRYYNNKRFIHLPLEEETQDDQQHSGPSQMQLMHPHDFDSVQRLAHPDHSESHNEADQKQSRQQQEVNLAQPIQFQTESCCNVGEQTKSGQENSSCLEQVTEEQIQATNVASITTQEKSLQYPSAIQVMPEMEEEHEPTSLCVATVKSPLYDKQKFLESSHKALQEKLAKVKEEIQQLSSIASSNDQAAAMFFGLISSPEPKQNYYQRDTEEINIDSQQISVCPNSTEHSRKKCEFELEKLREQLCHYNEEEKQVIRELEFTKSLRKAVEDTPSQEPLSQMKHKQLVDAHEKSASADSFYLNPQQLNFDSVTSSVASMKNSTYKLQSDCVADSCFEGQDGEESKEESLLTNQQNIINLQVCQQLRSNQDEGDKKPNKCRSAWEQAEECASNSNENSSMIEYKDQNGETDEKDPQNEELDQRDNDDLYEDGAMLLAASPDARRHENALMNRTKLAPAAIIQSGTDLPFSQIIEEEHESESAIETSANHSRRTSIINLPKVISQHTQNDSNIKNYYDFINENKTGGSNASQLSEQLLKSINERPSLNVLQKNQSLILASSNTTSKKQSQSIGADSSGLRPETEVNQYQVRPHSVKVSQLNNRLQLVGHKAETLKRFEKLIKETQQSDEGSLLKHIQMNLQQIKEAGDLSSRFSELQQQDSPSPLKQTIVQGDFHNRGLSQVSLDHRYLESHHGGSDSIDTINLIQEYQSNLLQEYQSHVERAGIQSSTAMSETIQFLAAAGQTGTSCSQIHQSHDHQTIRDQLPALSSGHNRKRSKIQPVLKQIKSRNGLRQSTQQSVPSSLETLGECQIKILQNHNAPETMSSVGCGVKNDSGNFQTNSIERLSKVSPYFQEHQLSQENVKILGEGCTFRTGTQGSIESQQFVPQEISLKDINMQVLDCGTPFEEVKSIFDQNDNNSAASLKAMENDPQLQNNASRNLKRSSCFASQVSDCNQIQENQMTFSDVHQKEQGKDNHPLEMKYKSLAENNYNTSQFSSIKSSQSQTKFQQRRASHKVESRPQTVLYNTNKCDQASLVPPSCYENSRVQQPASSSSHFGVSRKISANSALNFRTQKTTQSGLMMPVRSQTALANSRDFSNGAVNSSSGQFTINSSININAQRATSSRSCFNIYKRTSNRMMAKTHENGPKDLNKGQLSGFVSNSHFSDETLPMHVTSQTTLNLDQKCPFNISIEQKEQHQQVESNGQPKDQSSVKATYTVSGGDEVQSDLNNDEELLNKDIYAATENSAASVSSSQQVHEQSLKSSQGQLQKPSYPNYQQLKRQLKASSSNYELTYEDYINGGNAMPSKTTSALGISSKAQNDSITQLQRQHQQNLQAKTCQTSDITLGRQPSSSQLLPSSARQYNMTKTKSQSSLATANTITTPSNNLAAANQANAANIRTKAGGSQSVQGKYTTSMAAVGSSSGTYNHNLTHRSASSNTTVNMGKTTGRSNGTQLDNHQSIVSKIVPIIEKKASNTANSNLPSYMQPIHQKFKKQTMQMLQEQQQQQQSGSNPYSSSSTAYNNGGASATNHSHQQMTNSSGRLHMPASATHLSTNAEIAGKPTRAYISVGTAGSSNYLKR